jgi:hypothetical protein
LTLHPILIKWEKVVHWFYFANENKFRPDILEIGFLVWGAKAKGKPRRKPRNSTKNPALQGGVFRAMVCEEK